jgi:type II secretory pathway pseudopilin PulG
VKRRRGKNGFVLIETLAAFTILALALGALMLGVFGGVRNDDRAIFTLRAARAASSFFAALGVENRPPPGVSSGRTSEGLPYELTIAYLDAPTQQDPTAPHPQAFQAHLVLSRAVDATRQNTSLAFDTVKIVTEPPR